MSPAARMLDVGIYNKILTNPKHLNEGWLSLNITLNNTIVLTDKFLKTLTDSD